MSRMSGKEVCSYYILIIIPRLFLMTYIQMDDWILFLLLASVIVYSLIVIWGVWRFRTQRVIEYFIRGW
jgi:hypothetical protein